MPKRTDIKKVMVIGSGPIVIGQAAEFDYAGTQACLALKEEGYEVVLVNSNPATIQTDVQIADKVYMEPLTLEYVAKIVRYERPDAIVPGLGGQTGLNLAVQLAKKGVLQECQVEILGTSFQSIEQAEDRELFKELCQSLGEPVLPSLIANNIDEAVEAAKRIGYPVVLRPAFTLGGTGGGFADDETQLREMMRNALSLSPVHQVLIEKSIKGYKEIEYEVIRDHNDTAIAICNMENIDPVGVHTGDSIVVAPSQTLTNKEYQLLRDSALRLIRALKIEGGCNVQFALDPLSFNYYLIEVNPRVSRSSALASKASGYPIARVSAKIAVGLTLDEIRIANTPASFEPALDYVVTKIARFPFDKFSDASNQLGTQMKATGEVMSVGRTMEESLLKAVRSLETGVCHIYHKKFDDWTVDRMLSYIKEGTDDRLYAIAELIRRGVELALIYNSTKIDMFFLEKFKNIVEFEKVVAANPRDIETLRDAKRMGFSDKFIGQLWGMSQKEMFLLRREHNIFPVYKMIDTCASEFSSYVPYFYSTYEQENESIVSEREKIVVLGSGPIRIGQGVEFDYSTVHAIWSIRAAGYEAIIINNNPETVSTDYTTSDKLYFEPLTVEDVMNVITLEKPKGIVVSLGGQTAINLAEPLHELGVPIIGTGVEAIRNAEDRGCFEKIMEELGIPQPEAEAVTDIEAGVRAAERIGYPVLVRPSYVLGGRAMQIVSNEERLRHYLQTAVEVNEDSPVLVDRYIMGRELEVDAICDGKDVFIPGIMEHVEKTGIHSGDSISVYPTFSVSQKAKDKIIDYTVRLGRRIGIVGLYNIQFILDGEEDVYVIEVNPRSSRTVPFLSKATGVPMADIATRVILGHSLREQGITEVYGRERSRWFVKAPAFSFAKIRGMESYLSPEMKSTGEAIGYDNKLTRALYKALQSSGMTVANYGTIFLTIADKDKQDALPLVRRFYDLGFNIEATKGTAEFLRQHGIRTRTRRKLNEGINELDGTDHHYSLPGKAGYQPYWDSKLFDYGKDEVQHFLLSNVKYWLDEFHFDGYRFDGVTSMIYHHHGHTDFSRREQYFDAGVNEHALTYLTLANTLVHDFRPRAVTIAEEVSGMPGIAVPTADGGVGFDYRLGMAIPDFWIRQLKEVPDEKWDIHAIWHVLTDRLPGIKTVAYAESHDQALVGDQTMIFRLAGANMYTDMNKDCHNPVIDRAIALHKMIRLFTLSGGGEAYLNFMGNEFGHPEWIDFPREGNGWSFHYCRRQWSLKDNGMLKYQWLGDFDEDMVRLTKENRIFDQRMADLLLMKAPEQTLAYYRHGLVFVFNFHFGNSLNNVLVPVRQPGEYTVVLSTDDEKYGGFGNVAKKTYATKRFDGRDYIELYIPARTGFVLKEKVILPETPAAPKKAAK